MNISVVYIAEMITSSRWGSGDCGLPREVYRLVVVEMYKVHFSYLKLLHNCQVILNSFIYITTNNNVFILLFILSFVEDIGANLTGKQKCMFSFYNKVGAILR